MVIIIGTTIHIFITLASSIIRTMISTIIHMRIIIIIIIMVIIIIRTMSVRATFWSAPCRPATSPTQERPMLALLSLARFSLA